MTVPEHIVKSHTINGFSIEAGLLRHALTEKTTLIVSWDIGHRDDKGVIAITQETGGKYEVKEFYTINQPREYGHFERWCRMVERVITTNGG